MGCYEDPDDGDDLYTYWDSNAIQDSSQLTCSECSLFVALLMAVVALLVGIRSLQWSPTNVEMTIHMSILATTQVDKRLSEIPSYRGSNAVPPLCPVGGRQQLPENPLPQLLSQVQQGTDVANSRVSNYFSPNSCKVATGGPTSIATAAPNGQPWSLDRSTKNQLEHRCSDHSSHTDFASGRVDAESCAIVPAKIKS